ncbi:PaaI family thioesterase [Schlegelella sp. S2-27]|uniref:PaaI family thioesterase n=1 Tax=Caldimonas mangrovi TaxID=2944811 RepID=A0ABT0YXC3_9BURK|nr:PaaI family thioesterase [Caldimonas mangrovi]MCM5682831.1 PaaI family thioesterase [Caldimonas mangrovi]
MNTPVPAGLNPPDAVRRAVLSMPMAQTLGLDVRRVERGDVELALPIRDAWCFRPGQLQATAVFAAADFAAVAAAGTMLPAGWLNATVDATLKLLAPAVGSHLVARGRVIDAGRLLTVCAAEVYAVRDGTETLCATLLGTARNIEPRA